MLLACFGSRAQEYGHAGGVQSNFGLVIDSGFYSFYPLGGFVYNPRLDIELKENMIFSACSYPFIGGFMRTNTMTGGSAAFGAELPLLAQIFIGDTWGFFASAGWDFAFMAATGTGAVGMMGPQVALGFQTPFFNDRHLRFRLAYDKDVLHRGGHLASFGMMYTFGD